MSHGVRAWARGVTDAVLLAESAIARHIVSCEKLTAPTERNVFSEPVTFHVVAPAELLARAMELSREGRVAVVATLEVLASCRDGIAKASKAGLPIVLHALCGAGLSELPPLLDLPLGVVFTCRPTEALDWTLIARRATEEVRRPIVLMHETLQVKWLEPVQAPSAELIHELFRARNGQSESVRAQSSSGRELAEQLATVVAEACRVYEDLTGRRRDVIERQPKQDAPVVVIATGARGDVLLGAVESLRAKGLDVGAVKLSGFRPFPAARLVRLVGRTEAVVVIEAIDVPLASSSPLAAEIKSAFADAMTWAPNFPGIGRMPLVYHVRVGSSGLDEKSVEAIARAIASDEPTSRSLALSEFSLNVPESFEHATTTHTIKLVAATPSLTRKVAEAASATITSAVGAKPSVSIGMGDAAVDCNLLVSQAGTVLRGAALPRIFEVIAVDSAQALSPALAERLCHGGHLVFPTQELSAEALWSQLSPTLRALLQDRKARVWGLPEALFASEWSTVGVLSCVALLAARNLVRRGAALDAQTIEREVSEAVREGFASSDPEAAKLAGEGARAAFEQRLEIPRSYLEMEDVEVRTLRRSMPPR